MHPNVIYVLAAFLAIGDLQFGAAQDASDVYVGRPRWYFPREVKRTSRLNTQRNTHSEPGLLPDGALDNFISTQFSSSPPAVSPTPEISPTIQTQYGSEIVGVTISFDRESLKISNLVTGSTWISGGPSATTAMTTKTEISSAGNIPQGNSTAGSTNAQTMIEEEWTAGSSPNMPTMAASTTKTPSSTKNLSDDLAAGLGNLLDGSTYSSTLSTASTMKSAMDSPTTTSTTRASTKSTTLSTAIHNNLRSSLDILLGSSTSSFASVASNEPGFSSANNANNADSSKISDSNATGFTAKSAGLALPDHLSLGDNSSTEKSITANPSFDTSSQFSFPVNVSVSTTSSLLITSSPIGASTSSKLLDGLISDPHSKHDVTPSGTVSTTFFTTLSMPNGILSPSKLTGLVFTQREGATTVLIPTSTNFTGTFHVPYSPSLDSTSASGTESSTGDTEGSSYTRSSTDMESTTGVKSITSTEARTGTEASKYTRSSTGMESITGAESSARTRSGAVSSLSSLYTPTLEALTLSYHPSVTPLSTLTSEMSTTESSEERQSAQSANSAPLISNIDWMPPTILIVPTFTATVSSSSDHTKKLKATSLPGSIIPSNENTKAPPDSVLLQLGFNSQLPWSFVITTPLSSSQIFNYCWMPGCLRHHM